MINQERLNSLLIELIEIDSLSRRERDVALRLQRELEDLGARVFIDDAGEKVGGNVGNLIAHFPGTAPGAAPLLLSAHMDTVVPGEGIRPVRDGDILRTDGRTVLGGDDKSGVAIICEVLRVIRENGLRCGDVDLTEAIQAKYGSGCPGCGRMACACADSEKP